MDVFSLFCVLYLVGGLILLAVRGRDVKFEFYFGFSNWCSGHLDRWLFFIIIKNKKIIHIFSNIGGNITCAGF